MKPFLKLWTLITACVAILTGCATGSSSSSVKPLGTTGGYYCTRNFMGTSYVYGVNRTAGPMTFFSYSAAGGGVIPSLEGLIQSAGYGVNCLQASPYDEVEMRGLDDGYHFWIWAKPGQWKIDYASRTIVPL